MVANFACLMLAKIFHYFLISFAIKVGWLLHIYGSFLVRCYVGLIYMRVLVHVDRRGCESRLCAQVQSQ